MLRTLCGALLAFFVALGLPQDAEAKPSYVISGGEGFSFTVRGSNAYELEVSSSGRRWIDVTALGGRDGISVVNYQVRRRARGQRGFEAKLPGIGRIAVDFRPRGKPRPLRPEPGCTGKPGRLEKGTFVGTINFHGERGFTEVTATRAKGKFRRSHRQTCSIPEAGNGGKGDGGGGKDFDDFLELTSLVALTRGGVMFTANRLEIGGKLGKQLELPPMLSYSALQVSRSHGMQVVRMTMNSGKLESFTAEHTGRTAAARVEPQDPFSGSGDFAIATDGDVEWTGDLSVALPGADPVRLTGKRFEAELCVDERCAGDPIRPSPRLIEGIFSLLAEGGPSSAAPTPRLWPR